MQDNLRVHHNFYSIDRINELCFRYTWVPRYSPWYNGIEEFWSIGKRIIKERRLNAIMNNE